MKEKIGIVFSGGGAKGAYQIGVWQALIDLEIAPLITGVSGTSVGAIIGVLFAQGDIDVGYEIWEKAKTNELEFDKFNKRQKLLVKIVGETNANAVYNIAKCEALSSKRLSEHIRFYLSPKKLAAFPGDCFVATHDINEKQPVYFNIKDFDRTEQEKIILASASIPYIFSSVSFQGKKYNDGGLSDNTPIQPLYDAGYRTIIVVYLNRSGFHNVSNFKGATIINLMPSKTLGDFRTGTLNFSNRKIASMIEQGYNDTIAAAHYLMPFQRLIPYQN